jgi:hypothetical protein
VSPTPAASASTVVAVAGRQLTQHPSAERGGEPPTSGPGRSKVLAIGLSDPLTLEVWMQTEDRRTPTAKLALYRIPSEPGSSTSDGGTYDGALFLLDVESVAFGPRLAVPGSI